MVAVVSPTKVVGRRVRKEDVRTDKWIKPDGLDYCLDCWKTWMHGDPDRDLKAKTMALMSDSDGYGSDLYRAQEIQDRKFADATGAMIDSLKRMHYWAIYKMCGIATVWNYPNADWLTVAQEARIELQQKLKSNVCTSILF